MLFWGFLILSACWETNGFRIIQPGTKWCGSGDIAANYSDLGIMSVADACCRDHDHCEDYMMPGDTSVDRGLYNDGTYTRLNCDCDRDFYDCLKRCERSSCDIVGETYFNALYEKCYAFRHPATCVKYEDDCATKQRCTEYEYDTSQPMVWQWFEMQRYKKSGSSTM